MERKRLSDVEYTVNQEADRPDRSSVSFVPEVAGHLDEKLSEYAAKLNTSLAQTQVLGILNEYLPKDAIVIGPQAAYRATCSGCGIPLCRILTIWNMAFRVWGMKSPVHSV